MSTLEIKFISKQKSKILNGIVNIAGYFFYREKYLVKAQEKWGTNDPQEIGIFFVDKLLPDRSAKPVWRARSLTSMK
jgi:hypothetical protein